MIYRKKPSETKQRFTIKKFKVGAASVLIGTVFMAFVNTAQVQAEENANGATAETVVEGENGGASEVKEDEGPTADPAPEVETLNDTNTNVSESEPAKPTTRGYAVQPVDKPENSAMPRPKNEGQPFGMEGTAFRTVVTPTVTEPLPEGYGISPEKLPEKLSFMADPDPNMLVFGILQHVPRNKFYSFAKNRVDNTYTVSVYDSTSKARLSNDVISSVAGTKLTIDEGYSRVVVNHRSTEAGTSAIIFRAEAVTPDPTLGKLVFSGVYTDGYEDKRDPEARNNSTLDYYAPVLAYSATSHKDLLTDKKLQDDIVQSGYIGETYSTRALNREGEVGEKYDVIAPFNTTGALSNINWRGVGQVDEVVAEWAGGNVYDSSTGSVRTVTMFRKVRYEMINEQGDMKISVFYAEKLANNQPGEWHRAKVLNRKPDDRTVMIPSTGKRSTYYDVVPDKYEVIVKSIFSDEGPYRGFFEGHKIGDTHKLIQDGNIQANHAASGVINVRNPFRQASDKIIYYYTQEIAEVKFFDDTYGTMNSLPEIVTGFRGKGNTVIDVNQGRTQDNKTVADIIEKYRALGYRVKVNEFEASEAPKFNSATATYPTYGTSSEDIIANETTRRNNNRRVVNVTFEKPKGSVVVNYTDENGTPITGTGNDGQPYASGVEDTKDAYVGTDYNTNDHRPETITTADGVTYERVPNLTKGEESGQVTEGTKTVTYVYKKVTGDVIVNYVDENGKPLKASHHDKDDANIGEDFNTGENEIEKPTEFVANGKTYVLVPNKHATTTDGNTFTVVEGAPTETGDVAKTPTYVTYVYKEKPKGSVIVNYRIEGDNDTVIKEPVEDTKDVYVGTDYTTTDHKTPEIEHNGKTYVLVPDQTPEKETGKVEEGTTNVTYVYREKVTETKEVTRTVGYVKLDKDGRPVGEAAPSATNTVTFTREGLRHGVTGELTNPTEWTATNKDTTLDGNTLPVLPGYLIVNAFKANGVVTEETAWNQVGYNTTTANVDVTEANVTADETDNINEVVFYMPMGSWIPNLPNKPKEEWPNNPYPNNPNDPTVPGTPTEPGVPPIPYVPGYTPVIPGTTTPLTPVDPEDPSKGYIPPTLPENPTVDTHIPYVPLKGNVIVNYVDENGKPIKDPVEDTPSAQVGTDYTTVDNRLDAIKTPDGKEYERIPERVTGDEKGKVTEGTTEVTYIYKEKAKGTVVVTYINTKGEEIKTPVVDTESSYVGTAYDTTDNMPETIESEGKAYKRVPALTKGTEEGKVVEGTTTITYVYEEVPAPPVKQGTVVIEYKDTEGNVLKTPVVDDNNVPVGTKYDTTDEDDKPTTLVHDGEIYVLVPSKTEGTEQGEVVEGTTTITYVYQKVANWIPEIPGVPDSERPRNSYPFNPEKPGDPIPAVPEVPGKPGVPVIPHVDGYIPVVPGTTEPLKPVDPTNPSKGYVPPVPGNPGVDTRIPYVPAGKVVIEYKDVDGNTIKTPVVDDNNVPTGTSYDTTDEGDKPTEIVTEDGKRYELVPDLTKGEEAGKVTQGTTTITYVYKEKAKGTVIVNYVDKDGKEIKSPVVDTESSYVGAEYNTTDNMPETIEVDGKTYKRVPSLTKGVENGTVTEGETVVTYVYEEVTPTTPVEPGKPTDPSTPEPGKPTDPSKPELGKPAEPSKPTTPVTSVEPMASTGQLPETGEADSAMVFGATAMAVLAGLGLVAPRKKEE